MTDIEFLKEMRSEIKDINTSLISRCVDILKRNGNTSASKALELDDMGIEITTSHRDDIASVRPGYIWVEGRYIYANTFCYYDGQVDERVLLNNETEVNWCDVLEIILQSGENGTQMFHN